MTDEHGRTTEADQGLGSDIQRAASILQEAREHAQHQLTYRYPVLYTTWGLMYLLGYGAVWLSVRGQHPYAGPTPTALLSLTVVVAAAITTTVVLVGRAVSGIGGSSARQRRVNVLSAIAGFAALFTLEAALAHAGASQPVLGVYGAAAPILLTGVICTLGAAVALNRTIVGLGMWLVVVAAGSAFAGPVVVWAVDALAVSAAFFVIAAIRFGHRHGR
jgi:hypothetical protein